MVYGALQDVIRAYKGLQLRPGEVSYVQGTRSVGTAEFSVCRKCKVKMLQRLEALVRKGYWNHLGCCKGTVSYHNGCV